MSSLITTNTYFSLGCLSKRVDLQLQAVHIEEHGVEVLDLLGTLGNQLPLEPEELGQFSGHGVSDPSVDVHWDLLDPIRGLLSNLFNVNTTIRARKGKSQVNNSGSFQGKNLT